MKEEHTLAIRRRGSRTWSEIDRRSKQGRYLLSLFEHPTMEEENMSTASAMPIDPERPRLLLVPSEMIKTRFGLLVQAKRLAQQGYDKTMSATRSAVAWVRESFLDKAMATLATAWGWLADKARWVGDYIGGTGGVGLGMLAITTKTGRTVTKNTLGRVWGWSKTFASWTFRITLNGLEHLGAPGHWVADRMLDVADLGARAVGKAQDFYEKNLSKHFTLGSNAMTVGQLVGGSLVARQALTLASFTPLRYGIIAGLVIWSALTVKTPVEQATAWLERKYPSSKAKTSENTAGMKIAADEAIREGKVSVDAKAGNGYQKAMDAAAAVVAEAPAPVIPQNREQRRAAAREVRARSKSPEVATS